MRLDYGPSTSGDGTYVLYDPVVFPTPIKGNFGTITDESHACTLDDSGYLSIGSGFTWDLASGAIDTPDMVIASLAHDALCYLTNQRKVPWSVRAEADRYFRELLKQQGCSFIRRWYAYLAVSGYSLIAKYRDRT